MWSSDDRDQLREYLKRTDGKLLTALRSLVPAIDARTIEETALQSKEFKGASDIINALADLAEPRPERKPDDGFVDVTGDLPR